MEGSGEELVQRRPRLRRKPSGPITVSTTALSTELGTYFGDDDRAQVAQEPERPRSSGTSWRPFIILFTAQKIIVILLFRMALMDAYHLINPVPEENPSPPPPPQDPPVGRNMSDTEKIARFWYDFDQILSAVDEYETWFDVVNNATAVLDDMYAEIPPNWHEEEPVIYNELGVNIEARRLHVQLAEREYQKFSVSREHLLLSMLGEDTLLRIFVEGQPIVISRSEDLRENWNKLMWGIGRMNLYSHLLVNISADNNGVGDPVFSNLTDIVSLDMQQRTAIALAARSVTIELMQMNADLFENWDYSQIHLIEAQKLEVKIIREIRHRSRVGFTWRGYHGASICVLRGRVEKMQSAHKTIREPLAWLEKKFVRQPHETVVDWGPWLQSAKELLGGWAVASHDTQEAVLYMLRRRDVASKDPPRACAEASWYEWKERNCGGTSCYDDKYSWKPRMMNPANQKPKAAVARDEAAWS
ncbi:hypothetical protein NPX13_g9999 [Xylaria arbuscula]|uniref:Uncharacterized protein n=1 Tax=Xylaria arbuscula TaxID=114810 RepID=A0A9W8N5L0_9PEZI|nr:hypothetical protein NPX13_g9999 [Xylaria arbuscula]